MDIEATDAKETRSPQSGRGPSNGALAQGETEKSRQRRRSAPTEDGERENEQPLQHVRTLGKLRFRPADDDEPQ
jgi:hypothetical protein